MADNQKITAQVIAHDLLSIGAAFLSPEKPFIWASGIQSPIYCDNRLVLSAPQVRDHVERGIAEMVRECHPDCQMLMGTATAGIAHAALAAAILNLPMGYVRSSAKTHGRGNRIEGRMEHGAKVVVVEDLISTAGSSIETVEALREAGGDVLGIVSIFTYGTSKAAANLAAASVVSHSLSSLDVLVDVALEEGRITQAQGRQILDFKETL